MPHDDRDEQVVVVERSAGVGAQIAAFLTGLAVGAGVALLFAPRTGEETRREIARQAKRARTAAGRLADDLREGAADTYESVRSDVGRRAQTAKRSVNRAIDDVKMRVDSAREAGKAGARAAREELQRRLADSNARDDDSEEEHG